jgi:hypothetical protein
VFVSLNEVTSFQPQHAQHKTRYPMFAVRYGAGSPAQVVPKTRLLSTPTRPHFPLPQTPFKIQVVGKRF